MNRLTAIGLASLVAYGVLIATKYVSVVSAARHDKPVAARTAALDSASADNTVEVNPAPIPAPATVPFAAGFGMELGMTIDAVRAGFVVRELEIDLEHRATTRDLKGFLHRGRQLADFARAYLARRS